MDTIKSPTAQLVAGDLLYQVTLASGMIVTNPASFGNGDFTGCIPPIIISDAGYILSNISIKKDIEWEKRQAEAIADFKEGKFSVHQTGNDFLSEIDKAIARNEACNG